MTFRLENSSDRTSMDRQSYYRIIDTVDLDKIRKELDTIDRHETYALQGVNVDDDPRMYIIPATNSINAWERSPNVTADQLVNFHFDIPYTNSLLKKYNVGYARVMMLHGKDCYTYHKDKTKRIHIPIKTNENNFFVIEDTVLRLPADGSVYEVDTTYKHTFVNASVSRRTHIVGTIL